MNVTSGDNRRNHRRYDNLRDGSVRLWRGAVSAWVKDVGVVLCCAIKKPRYRGVRIIGAREYM